MPSSFLRSIVTSKIYFVKKIRNEIPPCWRWLASFWLLQGLLSATQCWHWRIYNWRAWGKLQNATSQGIVGMPLICLNAKFSLFYQEGGVQHTLFLWFFPPTFLTDSSHWCSMTGFCMQMRVRLFKEPELKLLGKQ